MKTPFTQARIEDKADYSDAPKIIDFESFLEQNKEHLRECYEKGCVYIYSFNGDERKPILLPPQLSEYAKRDLINIILEYNNQVTI